MHTSRRTTWLCHAFPCSIRHSTLTNPIRLRKLSIDFQSWSEPYLQQRKDIPTTKKRSIHKKKVHGICAIIWGLHTTRAVWWVTNMTTPSSTKEEASLKSFQPASPPTTPPTILPRLLEEAALFPWEDREATPENSSKRSGEADSTIPVFCPSRRHCFKQ